MFIHMAETYIPHNCIILPSIIYLMILKVTTFITGQIKEKHFLQT